MFLLLRQDREDYDVFIDKYFVFFFTYSLCLRMQPEMVKYVMHLRDANFTTLLLIHITNI